MRTLALVFPLLVACGPKKNDAAIGRWLDEPAPGSTQDNVIEVHGLGLKLEIPDTLYVFKECEEAEHHANKDGWIPVLACHTRGAAPSEDPYFDEPSDPEALTLTVYATKKTRPLDERAVAWFENQYKQAGLSASEVSYQHDYQKKPGIYAKLHVMNADTNTPEREIIQFMFVRHDVVFIARMDYPFGETRSVDADWRYILWNLSVK